LADRILCAPSVSGAKDLRHVLANWTITAFAIVTLACGSAPEIHFAGIVSVLTAAGFAIDAAILAVLWFARKGSIRILASPIAHNVAVLRLVGYAFQPSFLLLLVGSVIRELLLAGVVMLRLYLESSPQAPAFMAAHFRRLRWRRC
jgi:hypothetical protein